MDPKVQEAMGKLREECEEKGKLVEQLKAQMTKQAEQFMMQMMQQE